MANILIADDEISIRKAISLSLQEDGHNTWEADSKSHVVDILSRVEMDLAVSDLFFPTEEDGIEVIQTIKQNYPETKTIIITAHGSIDRAVVAIKAGADDFIEKGFSMDVLKFRINRLIEQKRLALQHLQLSKDYNRLRLELENRYQFDQIVGKSESICNMLDFLSRIIDDTDSTVLIKGESGTGKELVAKAIHYNGPRKDNPFVVINCAALPAQLLESELFGHEKGSYTGAHQSKPGKFEIANGGTIFLDEVGEIPPALQVKLLRFTQDKTFERIGATQLMESNVRIIAATNRHLEELVKTERFRQDLYYRLNVIPVQITPLRQRKEDIPLLVEHFLQRFHHSKKRKIRLSAQAMNCLIRYDWPGNVRELENLLERLVVTASSDVIFPVDLPPEIIGTSEKNIIEKAMKLQSLQQACKEFEKQYLLKYLEKHRWNISETARALGERRDTLSKKIKRHGLKSE